MVVPAAVSMLLLPITTRLFAPASYGNYVLAVSTLTLLQLVANAWLSSTIIRFYARAEMEQDTERLDSTAFALILLQSFGASLLFVVVLLLIRGSIQPELFYLMLIVPVQMFAFNLLVLPTQVLRARRQLGSYNIITITKTILPPVVGITVCLLMDRNVVGMMAGAAAASWLLVPIGYMLCFTANTRPKLSFFDRSWASKILAFGVPLIPALLMVEILDLSDRFIIGAYRGTVETGIYAASYSVAALTMQLITLLVTAATAPLIVSIWEQQGRKPTESFLAFVTRVLILIGAPAVVGMSLLSKQIMVLFSTEDYVAGAVIIPFVAGGVFLLGLQWIAQRGMMLANKTKSIMILYTTVGLLNIVLNIVLVPRFGYVAAAWTTFGCYVMLLILIALGSAPYLTWHLPYMSIFRSVVACGVMAGIVVFLNNWLINSAFLSITVSVILGGLAYGVVLVMTGEIPLQPIRTAVLSLRGAVQVPASEQPNNNDLPR